MIAETGTGGAYSTGSTEHIYLPTAGGPMPVAVQIDGQLYAVQSDHLNTPRRLVNADGQAVWQWKYSAFGEDPPTTAATRFADPRETPNAGTSGLTVPKYHLRYPGQYFDEESGLNYNGFRTYDPRTGRYLQADALGLEAGWNRFTYALLNPLSYLDEDGLAPKKPAPRPVPISPFPGAGGGGGRALETGRIAPLGMGVPGTPGVEACVPAKPSLSAHKNALRSVQAEVGTLPKGSPGKFGSPQAGDSKKGYRLDPPHTGAAADGDPESGYHFNWWDYTRGRRGNGGRSGAISIED